MEPIISSSRHSITFRMTVTICSFLILFQIILAVLTLVYLKRELKQVVSSQQFNLLTVVTQNVDQKLTSSLKQVDDVSRLVTPAMVRDDNAAQRFLDNLPGTHSLFDNGLFLFSPEGKLIAESPYRPNRRGRDISYRDYFKWAVALGQPTISEPYVSTHTPGAPSIIFTAPVRDKSGKMIALLGGSLNLLQDNFLGELSRTRIASTGYLYIITRNRILIMHPDKSRIMQASEPPGSNKLFDRALNGFEGTEENSNSRGLKSLASLKHLHAKDWFVGANYPLDEAYAPIWYVQKYFLLLIAVGSALVIIVVRFMMERFTSTLVRFADHVKNISAKHGEERLFITDSDDEIGLLARTFNTMVQLEDQKSEELVHASTHDALTGLYNRAYFDSELERLARGRQLPISVVVADIDGLKRCNDSIGHVAGDALIKATAQVLLESFRTEDIVARIGGDEFAVLLPGVDMEQMQMALERVRSAEARVVPIDGDCPLSISLGYTTSKTPDGLQEAFKQADRKMYLDKAQRKQSKVFAAQEHPDV
ncbi:MAG: diguanylate cyclase [Desulfuromonadaceae bacterium]|nr:diguanylate cyclase [Desulfuromonadaceae bacterium]